MPALLEPKETPSSPCYYSCEPSCNFIDFFPFQLGTFGDSNVTPQDRQNDKRVKEKKKTNNQILRSREVRKAMKEQVLFTLLFILILAWVKSHSKNKDSRPCNYHIMATVNSIIDPDRTLLLTIISEQWGTQTSQHNLKNSFGRKGVVGILHSRKPQKSSKLRYCHFPSSYYLTNCQNARVFNRHTLLEACIYGGDRNRHTFRKLLTRFPEQPRTVIIFNPSPPPIPSNRHKIKIKSLSSPGIAFGTLVR